MTQIALSTWRQLPLFPLQSIFKQVVRSQKTIAKSTKDVKHRPSPCPIPRLKKAECVDLSKLKVIRARPNHVKAIRSLLVNQHWPVDQVVMGLWLNLSSPYLNLITDIYSQTGDRLVIFEKKERTNEYRLIGFAVGRKKYKWMIEELENWAIATTSIPENIRIHFLAHCLRSPDFFYKYDVDYIYDIECVATTDDVKGTGVEDLLMRAMITEAALLGHPVIQHVSTSIYTSRLCERCGMKREWTMNYRDLVDYRGRVLFFPRRPNHDVCIYLKYFDPSKSINFSEL